MTCPPVLGDYPLLRSHNPVFSVDRNGVRGGYLCPPVTVGTSGVRGRVGEDITADLALAIARAVAFDADRAVFGRDARDLGRALVDALDRAADR